MRNAAGPPAARPPGRDVLRLAWSAPEPAPDGDADLARAPRASARLAAFEAAMLPHLDDAYRLARWMTGSAADAEDVVQDAYLRAFRFFDGWRGDGARAWLLSIVRNAGRYWLRRQRGDRETEPLDESGPAAEIAIDTPDPEAALLQKRADERLRAEIANLPEQLRITLLLREIDDLSYREIADATGVPIGTVMSRLARARGVLKAAWIASEREKEARR